MREQVQENIDNYGELTRKPIPKKGWVRAIREALGMSSYALAERLGCTRANVSSIEHREAAGTISLNMLKQAAEAMNCKLVYCLIPIEPLDQILEKQARAIAKKRTKAINHSMALEKQGLTQKQLQKQENDLVQELLQSDPKKLWGSE